MPIRQATYSDLLPASKVLAAAFHDEPLFGAHFHPHRTTYPDDMHLFFLRKLRLDWALASTDPTSQQIMLSHPPSDPTTITGVAIWQRKRSSPRQDSWHTTALLKAMQATNAAESLVYPNRAAAPANHAILPANWPFIAHHWTGSRADSWYLDVLGVDPAAGGKGYGKALAKYGFGLAEADGVGASVIAALDKGAFYEAMGFDVFVGTVRDFGGEANPMVGREGLGGTIHFWDGGRAVEGVKGYGEA